MHFLKTRLLIFALLLLPVIHGCGKKEGRDVQDIKISVLKYDNALTKAYRELNPKVLYGLASEREIGRVSMIILKFAGEKKLMESELKDLNFIKIDNNGSAADVETFEKWSYRHLTEGTGEEALPWTNEEYRLRYKMAKSKGKWIVESSKFAE